MPCPYCCPPAGWMPAPLVGAWVPRQPLCRKDVLPALLSAGIPVLLFEGIWQVYIAEPFLQVTFVKSVYLREMSVHRSLHRFRQHGDSISAALTVPHNDLIQFEVDVWIRSFMYSINLRPR